MAAKRGVSLSSERGQSLVEFLLVLPVMVGLVGLLVRVNTAIQSSIVNQQYARLQALYLTYNSNTYPELRLRKPQLDDIGYSQMLIGVSEKAIVTGTNETPDASVFNIVSPKSPQGADDPQTEPDKRSKIRIRTTVTLCTQPEVIDTGSGGVGPIIDLTGAPNFAAAGISRITENSRFDYCRAPRGRYVQ